MFPKLAACIATLAIAFSASAQMRRPPAVGSVFVKENLDCVDRTDDAGTPVCVIASSGGAWDRNAPYRKVMSMTLPYGRYVVSGRVLSYLGTAPIDPWVVIDCVLESGGQVIDVSANDWGATSSTYSQAGWVATDVGLRSGVTMALQGPLEVTTGSVTVNLSCRVQGQGLTRNSDGSATWGAPIQDVRFHTSRMMATAVPSVTRQ